ncbi:Phage abortive infection protein [Vibrio crassostreae]|uniref:putative phage abortive infection protein n=1 Tax=Vibrio crassostreae TaxID=246167 RepID=UPI001042B8A6|nr:putative phage abortive infection protein [Vibrio crassostreae]TCT64914.1 putative phage abortive infection protein [Vibrio crassostreae]TCT85132.1 putative phage abortive infection protein [Vibrio crassostreae]TCU05160.1 putative phage abortive infection protein [Vibrio crassostreae]TDW06284.1 putative phage abortive infection protein [Vibrio crassostreae]CAK1742370.1 Phage abortive infection protein [Vibrio crassostreae]
MKKSIIAIIVLVFSIVIAWYQYPMWIQMIFSNDVSEVSKRAMFGDSYGSLNTLFSGLAFAGIITSIFLQSQELRETRAEIKAQKEEFELQTKAMNKQVFETTFFQLLQLHNEIVQSLQIETGFSTNRKLVHGRDVFSILFNEKFVSQDYEHEYYHQFDDSEDFSDDLNGHYLKFHRVYGHLVGHYFRNIYQILKYVDQSTVEDKKFYSNLIRAQMSDYELGLLFYNCISDLGNTKFKLLIEEYEFFEHLHSLSSIEEHEIRMYVKKAYGTTNKSFIGICEKNT